MQFLGIIFLVLFVLELLSIVFVAKAIGGLAAIGLMILCFMFGSFLMKRSSGLSQLMLAGGILRTGGKVSLWQMLYPIRIPVAAFFFMIPGFFLDVIGLFLLMPIGGNADAQSSIFSGSTQHNQSPFGSGFQYRHQNDDDIIEGEFVVRNNKKSSQVKTKYLEDRN